MASPGYWEPFEHVVEDLRAGRCLLLLDLSNEAAPYVDDVFDGIHYWADLHQIPTSSILLVTQNRRLLAEEQSRTWLETVTRQLAG